MSSAAVPVLQAQDGSFYGTDGAGNMVRLSQYGNVIWSVPNDSPQIATADGGVIGASGTTYDSNGNATGQLASLPIQSWTGNEYQLGSVESVLSATYRLASSFWAVIGGNASFNYSAAVQYEPPQSGLRTISTADLTSHPTCNTFLNNLTTIAISNGRDPKGSGFTNSDLLLQIKNTATTATNYIYDGPTSNTLWDQCTEPNCVAMFPVWFTGFAEPNGYTVKQFFHDYGPGTYQYIEGLSQYNGSAIWLRLDSWRGAWKGLTSEYIHTLSVSKAGQVNSYGLGTLFHELLHKQPIGGGFNHDNLGQALGIPPYQGAGDTNSCSSAIANKCFPDR